jgi:hypothetical protein
MGRLVPYHPLTVTVTVSPPYVLHAHNVRIQEHDVFGLSENNFLFVMFVVIESDMKMDCMFNILTVEKYERPYRSDWTPFE